MYASLELLLIALLVLGSVAFVLRAAWRSVRDMSRDEASGCGGCRGCGAARDFTRTTRSHLTRSSRC